MNDFNKELLRMKDEVAKYEDHLQYAAKKQSDIAQACRIPFHEQFKTLRIDIRRVMERLERIEQELGL